MLRDGNQVLCELFVHPNLLPACSVRAVCANPGLVLQRDLQLGWHS